MRQIHITAIVLLLTLTTFGQEANTYFAPMKYRNIGPYRGGRSVTASGVKGYPLTYYMGTTGGGLWKTDDAGAHWENISDGYFQTGSVGAVAVSESHPRVVYCGMGEHAIRGVMTSYGDGVYKSTDGGKTWKHMGLETTEQISRIVIHPENPDIVYVAAQGKYSSPTSDRGVYRSKDGGMTWEKVLYANSYAGASELSMDHTNPDVLYAALWHHQRKPWKIISGGEGSGLYKSTDAGDTWEKLGTGLPEKMGKMAVSVCRSNPDRVYALIESDSHTDESGLYLSRNAGESWSQVSGDNRLTQRAWYYTELFTDPVDEETVYVLSAPALRSKDGGKSWERLSGTHGDFHDLWINPDDPRNMVIANDGGAAISYDHGQSWTSQDIFPTGQFYRINVDNRYPYNIYGGQQDNSSIRIASMSPGSYSISQSDWVSAAGGESAFLAFNRDNPTHTVGGSYLGTIEILDMESRASTQIMAAPIQYLGKAARDMRYLYNWNAPIIWSQHEPNTIYHCAQLVLKSTDMGQSWTEISPDLTRNLDEKQGKGGGPYTNEAVGAENYGTISYMVESPHDKGVFYTGSDDGYVHISRNNGQSWQNITPKDLGETLVNAIEVSPHDPATVYIACTKYKFGDYTPALYKSDDYGASWSRIDKGIPYGAYTRVVREDQNKKGLLYAGTERGVFISFDDGKRWEPFQLNLPVTPITDLMVHRNDLVVATSGRAFWILDNLSLIGQYEPDREGPIFYKPEPIFYGNWGSPLSRNNSEFSGTQEFEGVNPANGIELYYDLPEVPEGSELTLIITDGSGKEINSYSSIKDAKYIPHNGGGAPPAPTLSYKQGLNRFVWDMRHPIVPGVQGVYIEADFRGHKVVPGTYTATLRYAGQNLEQEIEIKENPTYQILPSTFMEYDRFMSALEQNVTEMHNKVNMLKKARKAMDPILKDLREMKGQADLVAQAEELIKELDSWDEAMVQRKSQAYDDVENFENKFTAEYLFLMNQTSGSLPRVNEANTRRKSELDAQWARLRSQANLLIQTKLPALNSALWNAGFGAIRWE